MNLAHGRRKWWNECCKLLRKIDWISLPKMACLKYVIILYSKNNINEDSPFDKGDVSSLKLANIFKKDSLTLKCLFLGIRPRNDCWSLSRIISKINIFAGNFPLDGFYWAKVWQNHGNARFNLYFKDNVYLVEQGNAKLVSSILAALNGNVASSVSSKSINTNYKNVSFPFKDSVPVRMV